MSYTDDSIITKTMPNYSKPHLNTTDNAIHLNNIYKALCDWPEHVCMGYKFTNSHINNTLKKDSAFFINSENIDRASNKLIGHLIN